MATLKLLNVTLYIALSHVYTSPFTLNIIQYLYLKQWSSFKVSDNEKKYNELANKINNNYLFHEKKWQTQPAPFYFSSKLWKLDKCWKWESAKVVYGSYHVIYT